MDPLLAELFDGIRPALLQIALWLVSFSTKIRSTVETFSTTLDKAQGIFNQLTSQVSSSVGQGEEEMLYDTFALFDASNTGYVSAQDLRDVAAMYSITALGGRVAEELFERYDASRNGRIDEAEFAMLVHGGQIPGAMAMVLRTYARRMSEVSGRTAAARLQDEVALAVTDYLTLLCSKNMTMVGWVSQALTNASLPTEFTADVLKQLAENEDSPARLTTADVGAILLGEMSRINATHVGASVELLKSAAFWASEGYDLNALPGYVERVVGWVAAANHSAEVIASIPSLAPRAGGPANLALLAREQSEAEVAAYQQAQPPQEGQASAGAAQALRDALLGGVSAASEALDPAQRRARGAGVPAAAATLLFAGRLASNASGAAAAFQDRCMAYSGQASSGLDNFANQVQSMLQRVAGFLSTMEKYSTPSALQRMEEMVESFSREAALDISDVLTEYVDRQLAARLPGNIIRLSTI